MGQVWQFCEVVISHHPHRTNNNLAMDVVAKNRDDLIHVLVVVGDDNEKVVAVVADEVSLAVEFGHCSFYMTSSRH